MLNGACSSRVGTITARVYDADGGYGLPVIHLTLGYNFEAYDQPKTADQASFTSEGGHRYFIQVSQSLCQGVGYRLQLAPTADLTATLQDTVACQTARGAAIAARRKLHALRAAAKKAHGARRRSLRSRMQLQHNKSQSPWQRRPATAPGNRSIDIPSSNASAPSHRRLPTDGQYRLWRKAALRSMAGLHESGRAWHEPVKMPHTLLPLLSQLNIPIAMRPAYATFKARTNPANLGPLP